MSFFNLFRKKRTFNEGDILCSSGSDGKFHVTKILHIDTVPGVGHLFHCTLWDAFDHSPTLEDVIARKPLVMHVPIAGSVHERDVLLGNQPPAREELAGFHTYLKHTNFPRYIKETSQSLEEVIGKAHAAFIAAIQAGNDKNHEQAIGLYTDALEIWPGFFEALDNRAMEKMNLRQWQSAIEDFDASIAVNPKGYHALFSKGECLLKMGKLSDSIDSFAPAIAINPSTRSLFEQLLGMCAIPVESAMLARKKLDSRLKRVA